MARLNVTDVRCEALFASGLQQSDAISLEVVSAEISRVIRQLGEDGCAGRMAQEFGDHPEAASERMRWARQLVEGLTSFAFPHVSNRAQLAA